jgi:hypothetical protein
MLTEEARMTWMQRGTERIGAAVREAMLEVNQEMTIEGYRMDTSINIGFEFRTIPSGEVDKRFLQRCGIVPEWEAK